MNDRIAELEAQVKTLQGFKDFVHGSLDDFGVPPDPDPEGTRSHGCRIEGRLNWLYDTISCLEFTVRNGNP